MKWALAGALVLGAAFALASTAVAGPPVLTSVNHVNRHPAATWTLPPGVKAQVAEVATSPATSTDGAFFFENVKAFDLLEDAQAYWVYNFQLDPGTYYVHISGLDEPCYYAGLCPVREYSQILTLVIPAPPPPPPPPPPAVPKPRYQASVRSIHPGAIVAPGSRRVWTYPGDTLRVSFRNATAPRGVDQRYRICYRGKGASRCRSRTLHGATRDTWRLHVFGAWVPCGPRNDIRFSWSVGGRVVATRRAWIYECV